MGEYITSIMEHCDLANRVYVAVACNTLSIQLSTSAVTMMICLPLMKMSLLSPVTWTVSGYRT